MLNHLSINNFVLIKKFEEDFSRGMTTITGETGAGKSIILNALSLILGGRSDSKFFKNKEEKIVLLADFNIDNNEEAKDYLKEKEFYSEDNSCIIRRVITPDGRSKSFINSIKCNVNDLKTLSSLLIEIHSQNKNLEFLSDKNHIDILDSFSNLNKKKEKLKELTISFNKKQKNIQSILDRKDNDQSRLQLLNYKYNELKELELQDGEVQELEDKQKLLSASESIIKSCEKAIEYTNSEEYNSESILSLISKIKKELNGLDANENDVVSIYEMVDTIEINANELESALNQKIQDSPIDEEELYKVNERLEKIYSIAKKNFILPEGLYQQYVELENEINEIDVSDEDMDLLYNELENIKEEWLEIAKEISLIRKEKSKEFSEMVTDCLSELKMEGSLFKSLVTTSNDNLIVNENGIDNVEFMLSSNLGQTLQRMDLVASGGEMSRIGLAIQSIISKYYKIPTIVFDEVDTGIGGVTANVIGKYLNKISKHSQVICISHLPQVVVHADNYLTVKKHNTSEETFVDIKYITNYDLINEIARMVGNETLDGEAIAQAKKMITTAKDCVNG